MKRLVQRADAVAQRTPEEDGRLQQSGDYAQLRFIAVPAAKSKNPEGILVTALLVREENRWYAGGLFHSWPSWPPFAVCNSSS